jgi:sugar lactone lactonase YvrE
MKQIGLKDMVLLGLVLFAAAAAVSGCRPLRPLRSSRVAEPPEPARSQAAGGSTLVEIAASEKLWTGIAISGDGRIFVCFPRWSDEVPISVGEVLESGRVRPFPNTAWNHWDGSASPREHFVCVQSVYVDRDDNLWILDAANPFMRGVVAGGAKLIEADIDNGKILRTIVFDEAVAPPASYLNDVRVDTDRDVAYLTDSGLGALVVVDLDSGQARRVLADHASTKSEGIILKVGGREWRPGGKTPEIHVDGLALDRDGKFLYYHALTGRTLYRIDTSWLRDATFGEYTHATKVESLYETCAADGMAIGPEGYLYLTSIEDNSIKLFLSLGKLETVVKDPRLKWPDSIAWGPDGYMYVTTSQINLGDNARDAYKIFKVTPRR